MTEELEARLARIEHQLELGAECWRRLDQRLSRLEDSLLTAGMIDSEDLDLL